MEKIAEQIILILLGLLVTGIIYDDIRSHLCLTT